jgi:FMN phosphatase YigB (HAD superfamily)
MILERRMMKKYEVLLFDVDGTLLDFNKAEEDGATMEVTLFVKRADGAYERLDETHRQYRYTKTEIFLIFLNLSKRFWLTVESIVRTEKMRIFL